MVISSMPPLPFPDDGDFYTVDLVESIQEAAYAAGRDAGLEEAAKTCDEQRSEPECLERATYCADAIRALKSDAKEPL